MKKLHYGWIVCLGCALLLFCTSGLCINAFTIYQPYIRAQNGFTNAQSSAIITVRSLFSFASVFLTGFYFKWISLRWGTFLGGHLTMLATAEGFGSQTVATAITVTGLFLIVGKCAYGWISEKLGTVVCNWIMGSLLIAGLALCCVTSGSVVLLFAAMCAYGLGLSMATVGITAWAGDLAAVDQYDSTVRWFQTLSSGGALIFSSFPGILADHFGGSYIPAYICFAAFAVFVLLAIQWTYYRTAK